MTSVLPEEIRPFFSPRNVLIVGASEDPAKVGGRVLAHLIRYGFPGMLHVVNPARAQVQGLPAVAAVTDLPADADIDLAIVATPAETVPDTVADIAARGIGHCIIVSSGFGELDAGGAARENQLREAAHAAGLRVLGPNCQGTANTGYGFVSSFSSCFGRLEDVPDGPVAVVSQSGAMAAILTELTLPHVNGVRYWAATGNEVDLGAPELIAGIATDPSVRTVLAYIEDLSDGEGLARAAAVARDNGTTILLCKAGATESGGRAAGSHTGAMAQPDDVVDAFLRRHLIVRARDPRQVSEFARLFAHPKRPAGPRVGIISNSGGLGVLLSDECERRGLVVPPFPRTVTEQLSSVLPEFAAISNPVDLTGALLTRAQLVGDCLRVVMGSDEVDVVLVALGIVGDYYDIDRIVADVVEGDAATDKPVVVSWIAGKAGMVERFAVAGVPAFDDTTGCVRALGELCRHRTKPTTRAGTGPPVNLMAANGRTLAHSEYAGKQIVARWGLPVTKGLIVAHRDEALAAAHRLGYPVAAKLSGPRIRHKTELGLVHVGLKHDAELAEAAEHLLAAPVTGPTDGVLVERMAPKGVEMTVGVLRDPSLGPVVLVGAGGAVAELLSDSALLIPPLSREDVDAALRSLALFPLLEGYRGAPAADVEALIELVVRLGDTPAVRGGEVVELDLNPVIVGPPGSGACIVDVALTTTVADEDE